MIRTDKIMHVSTSHTSAQANTSADHKSLPFPFYLLNPYPLEADGLNCGEPSIFKLDILVISLGSNIVMEFMNTKLLCSPRFTKV